MNETLKNLTKLRIAGLLSEAARQEVERKIQENAMSEAQKRIDDISFG